MQTDLFKSFESSNVEVAGCRIFLRAGGSGDPVLLLHGFPQTHHAWAKVANRLSERYRVIVPDLPGYGESMGPEPTPSAYAKRHLAEIFRALMSALGHERFHIAGHDRGGRIAYRMALDTPECLLSLGLVDIVPTLEVWDAMNWQSALSGYHWSLLAQPAPLPERLIGADGPAYVHHLIDRWVGHRDRLDPAAVAAYAASFKNPDVIAAVCADYRAGATIDRDHDLADRDAGQTIEVRSRLIWGQRYLKSKGVTPLEVWQRWAVDVDEVALDVGHFVAEEAPKETAEALEGLFATRP